jgi:hypothetical protein
MNCSFKSIFHPFDQIKTTLVGEIPESIMRIYPNDKNSFLLIIRILVEKYKSILSYIYNKDFGVEQYDYNYEIKRPNKKRN